MLSETFTAPENKKPEGQKKKKVRMVNASLCHLREP